MKIKSVSWEICTGNEQCGGLKQKGERESETLSSICHTRCKGKIVVCGLRYGIESERVKKCQHAQYLAAMPYNKYSKRRGKKRVCTLIEKRKTR